jgi:CBS domain-containing protein
MREGLITCPPESSLGEAAALLVHNRIHGLVVTDGEGAPAGVLSDTDLLAGEWLGEDAQGLRVMRSMTAGEMMTVPIESIDADADVRSAAERMRANKISRLIVVDDGAHVGVVAVSDLVSVLAHAPTPAALVADVMSQGIVVALPDAPLGALARAMNERRSRSVVVVDAHGKPLGVVTGSDLLPLVARGETDRSAQDLMHAPETIAPSASLREAADAMLRHEVHRLVVVDPDRPETMPLGIVSTSDIVAEMADRDSVWAR